MLSKVLLDVEHFVAVIALKSWVLVVNHVRLNIAQWIEDFSALIAWDFLFGSVRVVDVVPQTRIAVEAFVAVGTFILPLTVVNISYKLRTDETASFKENAKETYECDFWESPEVHKTCHRNIDEASDRNACESYAFLNSSRLSELKGTNHKEILSAVL